MAFIAGPSGAVLVGGVAYAFGKWRVNYKIGLPKCNNFTSDAQILVAGVKSATVTVEGAYNSAAMPLVVGTSYALTLRFTAGVDLTVTAFCESIDPSQDIDDAARITATFQSTGSFTGAVT